MDCNEIACRNWVFMKLANRVFWGNVMRYRKVLVMASLMGCVSVGTAYAGELIREFGFEGWTGNRYTTQEYPFSSSYTEYCQQHDTSTEVVSSYNGWTPHSGSYFFLRNDSPGFNMSPAVDGISAGDVNDVANIGFNGDACSTSDLRLPDHITTGEIFISFYARMNKGFTTIANSGRCKWIRVYGSDGEAAYMHLSTESVSPSMFFYSAQEGGWLGSGVRLSNVYDGNWHKFSFYINYNTGQIMGWYDVDTETTSNATKSYTASDGRIANSSGPERFVIQGNFSAMQPTELTYHALDDLEIWDGMPERSDGSVTTLSAPADFILESSN